MDYRSYKKLFPVCVFFVLIYSCDDLAFQNREVEIRVENASPFVMEKIEIGFPDRNVNYGSLNPGEKADYETLSKAFRYAFIEMQVEGKRSVLQPIDYVGEDFLDPGRYTYRLNVNKQILDSNEEDAIYSLTLELKED